MALWWLRVQQNVYIWLLKTAINICISLLKYDYDSGHIMVETCRFLDLERFHFLCKIYLCNLIFLNICMMLNFKLHQSFNLLRKHLIWHKMWFVHETLTHWLPEYNIFSHNIFHWACCHTNMDCINLLIEGTSLIWSKIINKL